jgi:hypothetical protein
MTGHFTSYENRTDHELTTGMKIFLDKRREAGYGASVNGRTLSV